MNRTAVLLVTLALLTVACDPGGTTDPEAEPRAPDPALGRVAFEVSCGPCHASLDAFDLAIFDFPASDVIRRAVGHVDSATARDILAYVETLDVEPRGRAFNPFEPPTVLDDARYWRHLFGTDGWPEGLAVEDFAAIDLRDVPAPVPFPPWSSEIGESDWMPEAPLPQDVLAAEGGAVRRALEAYYAQPSRDRLLAVVEDFQRVTRNGGAAPVCAGSAAVHERPVACFEARRWVSSLTAIHLLREGEERDVPYEVAELWWDTGEVGISVYFRVGGIGRPAVVAWLYMSSAFAPEGFPNPESGIAEDAGYMGQFLQSSGRPRAAVVATLRRLASRGPVHLERPFQDYWDANLAVTRAPSELFPGVLEIGLAFLAEQQAAGRLPEGEDREVARRVFENVMGDFERAGGSGDPERDARIRELGERVLAGLGGAIP